MTKQKLLFAVFAFLMMTACGPTPEELVKQGKDHLEKENYAEALACFQKAAEKGDAEAEYNIGALYDTGLGVEEDDEIAADWYKKSAEKGYGPAQDKLATVYFSGSGVAEDFRKAAKWAQLALEQDDYWQSMMIMGVLYYMGEGVPKDYRKAVDCLERAIDIEPLSKVVADDFLMMLYLEGDGVQNDERVIDILCDYSDFSDRADAMFVVANLYFGGGDVVEKDTDKAMKWLRKSADAGNAEAQNYLGMFYYKGEFVSKNIEEAKYWWQKAADQGNEDAKGNLETLDQLASINAFKANRFSVSRTKQVNFSKGNLQYNPSKNKWRFATNQWDYIGDANKNVSSNYNGWIDLFGWGTGKNPTNTSMNADDYRVFNDWGRNNISGGNGIGWCTLTKSEWVFLLSQRSTNSGIRYALGTVNGVSGIILLPDKWEKSNYYLKNTNDINAKYNSNNISKSDWINKLEANGAVFLPAAGSRIGSNVQYPGYGLNYWSATSNGNYDANSVWAADGIGGIEGTPSRIIGNSVRLVCVFK